MAGVAVMNGDLIWSTLGLGSLIFMARVVDVSAGTMRTISIVYGRTVLAFFLGFIEVSIWLAVISAVLTRITSEPVLGVFYALGFSTGNVVGIKLEKYLAMGYINLRVISRDKGEQMAGELRQAGYAVTTFQGQGRSGPVTELYVVCRRRDMSPVLRLVTKVEPGAFYITEQAGMVSKVYRPLMQPFTGWRAVMKKK
jgi:uncharacterized protein YebE (UPF0316 family)